MRVTWVVGTLALLACGGGSRRSEPSSSSTAARAPSGRGAGPAAPAPPPRARAAPAAQTLARVALEPRPSPLLAGRLHVKLPARTRPIPDEPGHDPSFPREGRYRIEVGAAHVILRARELVARQSGDLEADARAEAASWPRPPASSSVEHLAQAGAISVLRLIPAAPAAQGIQDGFEELALAAALFVAHPDGSMLSIELHANEAAVGDAGALRTLATRIGGTVTAGRRLALTQGTKVFTVYRRGPELRIDLPAQTVAVEQDADESETYVLRPLRPMGGAEGTITVRIGGAPDPAERGRRRGGIRGRLLERDVSWHREVEGSSRTLTTSFATSDYPIAVTLTAGDDATLAALRSTVETMRLSRPCNQPGECPAGERCESEFCRTRR